MKKRVYRVRTRYIFAGVFEVSAESREDARHKVILDCGLVMGDGWKPSQHSSWWGNQLGFLHTPRSKDGTNNHSRRTDRVKRSADLPAAPFFRELGADKERSKETPMKSTLLLLTVSWDGLKVTKPFGVRIVLYIAILSHRMDFMADKTYWYANCFIYCMLSLIKLCKWKIEKGYVL